MHLPTFFLPSRRSHHALLLFLPLQQSLISLDPGIAGQEVLGSVKNLFSLTASQQKLVGALSHSHLKVKLRLHTCVLCEHNTQKV